MHGCYALKTQHGSHLVEMKRRMNQQVASKRIQLVDLQHMENMHLIHLLRMKKNLRN
ncbi:DUF6718 family protein [Anaerostipes hadrus]|nr:DUF6718 family protein [Anaerostipes hadrus]